MKSKLTLENAVEKKLTPVQCVQYYYPKADDVKANDILWEQTCFPFDMETTLGQLYNKYKSLKELGI